MARNHIIPIFVPHWGCPNQCVFCDQKRISGSPRPACAADVTETLGKAWTAGIRDAELAFYGGSFTAVPEAKQTELLAAAQPFRVNGLLRAIRLSTRPDAVDEDTLTRLAAYGVETVELGSQSMDDAVLLAAGRGHTAADTVQAAALVKASGRKLVLQMMTGLPGATAESDRRTAEQIITLAPDAVRIYPTVIVRGTELYERWQRGEYREHTVAEAVSLCAELLPKFQEAGIPVIRLGLNPTAELSAGQAAGGAYHPAFGELVQSEILRRRAAALLRDIPPESHVVLRVRLERLSAMIGQKRANVTALQAEFGLASLKVKPDPAAGEEILVGV